jgi:hypothetical protein
MANLEIPQFFKDNVSRMLYPVEEGSHEPIPVLPIIAQQRLMIGLLAVSSTLGGTTKEPSDLTEAFEAAYSLFASSFVENGATLTPGLLELDIPNMVFNFALHEDWFTSVRLHGDRSEGYELLGPRRYPIGRILSRVFTVQSGATVGWFTKAVQPSISRWKIKLIEGQIQPFPASGPDDEKRLANYRQQLLADFKMRVKNPETGKSYSDYALYNASKHSMYKPEFYKWRSGTLPADHPAAVSFERFLKDDQRPRPRKTTP